MVSIPYMQLRGGSSKGIYFLASDLPEDVDARDQAILDAVGRDARQIDGLGGKPINEQSGGGLSLIRC